MCSEEGRRKVAKWQSTDKNDFSQGAVWRNIVRLALPMTVAQLIQVLYNVVDRIYIGHLPGASSLALTGLGLTFPILTMITAFTNLFGMGGAPLCSIARGKQDNNLAEKIMGNSLTLLLGAGVALTILCMVFKRPILYLFGASDDTYPYADQYLSIYLCGTLFVMMSLGMNGFINAQGFARQGMLTITLGAVTNIILDPVFIFLLDMGVRGAALATVLSQLLSALWVMRFLTGPKAILRLRWENLRLSKTLVGQITGLGLSGFIMAVTNGLCQIVCNATLQIYGGDLYVGVMTVLNSVREIFGLPVTGITNGAQPVLGYNYGAQEYRRVKEGIKFMSIVSALYTTLVWLIVLLIPRPFIQLFNNDPALLEAGAAALKIYFFGYFMMSLQFAGQATFVGLGKSRQAVFFSLLRKAVIVVPLTLILPRLWGLGIDGVFLAEPISNFIGGIACFTTMLLTVWRKLGREEKGADSIQSRK